MTIPYFIDKPENDYEFNIVTKYFVTIPANSFYLYEIIIRDDKKSNIPNYRILFSFNLMKKIKRCGYEELVIHNNDILFYTVKDSIVFYKYFLIDFKYMIYFKTESDLIKFKLLT